jgi:hypothetical protein
LCARRFLFFAACLLPAVLAVALASQESASEEAPPTPPPPFSIGERLVYKVKWDPPWYLFFLPAMEAGEVDVKLVGESEYKNKKVLKIVLQAHSSGALANLAGMKVDDEFVLYSNPETFCTLSVSKRISEGKRKRQIDVEYLQETRQLHIREVDESVTPPKLKKDETKDNIPVCVQDPLSALYLFRMSQLRVQHAQTFFIGHDDKIKEVTSRVETQENIEIPVGKFSAWRISTAALMGGLFKEGGQFTIWLSADERKLPLQFEAKVRLGKVLGKLKQVQY